MNVEAGLDQRQVGYCCGPVGETLDLNKNSGQQRSGER